VWKDHVVTDISFPFHCVFFAAAKQYLQETPPPSPFSRMSVQYFLASRSVAVLAALLAVLVAISCASKDEIKDGNIQVSFINFSSEPISLFRHNGSDFILEGTIEAYETRTVRTQMRRTFAYGKNHQPANKYTVSSNSKVVAINGMEAVRVLCKTTKGDIHMTIEPSWSPLGAGRFLHLVHKTKYYDGCALNRVVPKFLTQLGIGADYEQRTKYRSLSIPDDDADVVPPTYSKVPFRPGIMSYAGSGPNSRSTEFFVVMPDTPQRQLDFFGTNPWETPFGYVHSDDVANVVAKWYSYGDMPPWGQGPDPQLIYQPDGYEYLKSNFPEMDYIETCRIVPSHVDDNVEEL
jgi:peptidyl-prolyl cis-trans isomerase A (cyclophilin A)